MTMKMLLFVLGSAAATTGVAHAERAPKNARVQVIEHGGGAKTTVKAWTMKDGTKMIHERLVEGNGKLYTYDIQKISRTGKRFYSKVLDTDGTRTVTTVRDMPTRVLAIRQARDKQGEVTLERVVTRKAK